MNIASKPLKPKKIKSHFSINDFLDNLNRNEFLVIGYNDIASVHSDSTKKAKNIFRKMYPNEKILTIKKLTYPKINTKTCNHLTKK